MSTGVRLLFIAQFLYLNNISKNQYFLSAPVIAATCLSVGHPVLIRRKFDLCIVDEAAQALQLAVIGPLTAAKRFVLVGDPLQLPPVVQSRAAK